MPLHPPIDEKELEKSRTKRPISCDDQDPKAKKQSKQTEAASSDLGFQTNLHSYFSSSKATKATKSASPSIAGEMKENQPIEGAEKPRPVVAKTAGELKSDEIPSPMIPKVLKQSWNNNGTWRSVENEMVLIRKPGKKEKPRDKVAAFDLDGTLFIWKTSGWPSQLSHYELWASTVPERMRDLHDKGFKLLLVSNQGGIQTAHEGKKAQLVKVRSMGNTICFYFFIYQP